MKVEIIGTPEEIAALVLAVQERQSQKPQHCFFLSEEDAANIGVPGDEILLVSHGLKNGLKCEKLA